jgi:IS5 family transposase
LITLKYTTIGRQVRAGIPGVRIVVASLFFPEKAYWMRKGDIEKTEKNYPLDDFARRIHTKVRYRGLMKNTAQHTTLFALSNL